MSVDTILIIYIRLQRRQSNQSNQNDRKQTENKYPLEQNEYESDNESGWPKITPEFEFLMWFLPNFREQNLFLLAESAQK